MSKKTVDKRSMWLEVIFGGVLVVAAWMRLYDIQRFPGGIYPGGVGSGESVALYPLLIEFFVSVLGAGVWQVHIVSAIIGVLTVVAIYFATRVFFGRLAGVLAAFFLGMSYWHVTLSRGSFSDVLIPLFLASFTAFVGYLIQAVKDKKEVQSYVYGVLAGVMFAGGFYVSFTYGVLLFVVLSILLLLLLAAIHPKIGFPHVKRYGVQGLVALAVGLVLLVPLGWYFLQEPVSLFEGMAQVSIFNPELQEEFGGETVEGTFYYSTRETLLSFFYGDGDMNWRHSVPGNPLLDPLVGLLFLLGFAWTIKGTVRAFFKFLRGVEVHMGMIYPYLLFSLIGFLVPVVITAEGIPNGLRSIGLIIPIFVLAGTAGAVVVHWVQRRVQDTFVRSISLGLLYGAIIVSGLYGAAQYMVVARNDSGAAYAYRSDLPVVSRYLHNYAQKNVEARKPLLVLDSFSGKTVSFLSEEAYRLLDPVGAENVLVEPGEYIVFTQSTLSEADRYERLYGGEIELVESRTNRFGQEIMRVYKGAGAEEVPGPVDDFNLDA